MWNCGVIRNHVKINGKHVLKICLKSKLNSFRLSNIFIPILRFFFYQLRFSSWDFMQYNGSTSSVRLVDGIKFSASIDSDFLQGFQFISCLLFPIRFSRINLSLFLKFIYNKTFSINVTIFLQECPPYNSNLWRQ